MVQESGPGPGRPLVARLWCLAVLAHAKAGQASSETQSFPTYQDVQPSHVTQETPETQLQGADGSDTEPGSQDHIRTVQRCINTVRKADNRLRKNREAQITRDRQWATYQQEVKAQFASQRRQYMEDCSRSRQEQQDIKDQKAAALLQLQQCISDAPMNVEEPRQALSSEDQQHWDALMQPTPQMDGEDRKVQALLQQATQAGARHMSMADKATVQQWLDRHGGLAGPTLVEEPDPWHPANVPDAELRVALAQSLAGRVSPAGLPCTPARTTPAAPRTPLVHNSSRQVIMGAAQGQAFSSRVAPFPPPAHHPGFPEALQAGADHQLSVGMDPYLFVGSLPQHTTATLSVLLDPRGTGLSSSGRLSKILPGRWAPCTYARP